MTEKIIIINGPNLNMLGTREPEVYGNLSLKDIEDYTENKLRGLNKNVEIEWFQSNSETDIINKIQNITSSNILGLVINPAAYSHTSVAIMDALKLLSIPKIEVHLSMTLSREDFRHMKMTAKSCDMLLEGCGKNAYFLGILALLEK